MPFMPGMFRSEEMTQCQLFLQSEASYACVAELGELGIVQFKDLNPDVNAFQRKFVNEVRRCEEMERKLRYIEKEVRKEGLKIPKLEDNLPAPPPKDMVDLEATFEKVESELREVNTNAEALKRNSLELTELKEVLLKSSHLFGVTQDRSFVADAHSQLGDYDRGQGAVQLGFVAGVIPREKCYNFEKIMKRCTRNNTYFQSIAIDEPLIDPASGDPIHKHVFIVFFQGEQLKSIVRKVCDGFKVSLYPCPEAHQEREEMYRGVSTRLEDLKTVLNQTDDHRHRVLVGAQKELRVWITKVEKVKAIYHTLNMFNFDVSHNSLIAECWTPLNTLNMLRSALKKGEKASGSHIPSVINPMISSETPPTFFRTNRVTQGFQSIVDAYGVAEYMEVNPTPYTIISFPFLFAVMFGDFGHGMLMFLFGLWMVLSEKKLAAQKSDNEIWNTFFGGRYIITLMGLFSMYTGLIYNDIFSKSFNIFGSAWSSDYTEGDFQGKKTLQMNPVKNFRNGTPYEFGIDPVWQSALNKITFMNSFKMKTAIILGISQMLFGICLSVFNNVHFRRPMDFFCEFLPEFIFLMSLFGYLVALVYYKWVTFTSDQSGCAPSLLIQYINMFMFKYSPSSGAGCDPQATFYSHQQVVQTLLVVLAAISAPWLLIIKPFILRYQHKRRVTASLYVGLTSTDALLPNEHHQEESNGKPGRGQASAGTGKAQSSIELGRMHALGEEQAAGHVAASTRVEPHLWRRLQIVNLDTHVRVSHEETEEEFDFSEIFIHQAIHTIEFCLGCISHTASYLRLWALSLAHAQLSEVLWTMVLQIGLKMGHSWGFVPVMFLWYAWAVLTVAVLLMMEGLSAFLHTLRLHWVEFQSKFYHGTGYQFEPFSFKEIMEMESLQDQ